LKRGSYGHSKTQGGQFSKIRLSGHTQNDITDTAVHEFTHRMEDLRPGLLEAEREFFNMRTVGEEWQSLQKLYPGHGYRTDEISKVDRFKHAYSGKEYTPDRGYSGNYYEIATMGVEDAFRQAGPPEWLTSDTEYRDFIAGVLAIL
jgi:hypothetical protein